MKKIAFIIPPSVELLDLAGPVQVFTEAKFYGFEADMEFYAFSEAPVSTSGLGFGPVRHFSEARLQEGDFVFVPGMDYDYVTSIAFGTQRPFFNWLKNMSDARVTVGSICNGAFALGMAGLLKNTECTTHWRRVKDLQQRFPEARVVGDILYIKSNNIYTSAGISAGIDLALAIMEDIKGPLFTHKIARGLVVYHRRSGMHRQQSIYLDYRNHINPQVHEVQDYLIDNLSKENSIETLAALVNMSPRNLSRVFKEKTGATILDYHTRLRREYASTMLNNPEYTIEYIAAQCGFKSARQLQRILKTTAN
ncbi:GlxA family transcriptional regulator [Mucilaginibacter sp. UR6-11]|uniref:GlxA family transcriptional regulator n=1 Tax=Mucilaginibacter sp. UR6-11 TaxID=1435644 RepID=UPI001E4D6B3A|nr:DJ-1/PfpI family protein [Mucilaginibacter sp. UR6-11]MCC8423505.1 DJ-1/PfpI family protein [Mucilaginibacter sp. UR6-11]